MTRLRRVARVGVACGAISLFACPSGVSAHAFLVKSVPAARATLARAPERVQLWFNERLEPAYSSTSVWDVSGGQMDRRDSQVSPEDPRRLEVTLPDLPPGRYVVRFRVLSVDGHVVESSLPVTVKRDTSR